MSNEVKNEITTKQVYFRSGIVFQVKRLHRVAQRTSEVAQRDNSAVL
jgi:hypothetical protein